MGSNRRKVQTWRPDFLTSPSELKRLLYEHRGVIGAARKTGVTYNRLLRAMHLAGLGDEIARVRRLRGPLSELRIRADKKPLKVRAEVEALMKKHHGNMTAMARALGAQEAAVSDLLAQLWLSEAAARLRAKNHVTGLRSHLPLSGIDEAAFRRAFAESGGTCSGTALRLSLSYTTARTIIARLGLPMRSPMQEDPKTRRRIERVLARPGGTMEQKAAELGLTAKGLSAKMGRLGLARAPKPAFCRTPRQELLGTLERFHFNLAWVGAYYAVTRAAVQKLMGIYGIVRPPGATATTQRRLQEQALEKAKGSLPRAAKLLGVPVEVLERANDHYFIKPEWFVPQK